MQKCFVQSLKYLPIQVLLITPTIWFALPTYNSLDMRVKTAYNQSPLTRLSPHHISLFHETHHNDYFCCVFKLQHWSDKQVWAYLIPTAFNLLLVHRIKRTSIRLQTIDELYLRGFNLGHPQISCIYSGKEVGPDYLRCTLIYDQWDLLRKQTDQNLRTLYQQNSTEW